MYLKFAERPPARLVFEIRMEGSARKVITVRSALCVDNQLDCDVEVRMTETQLPTRRNSSSYAAAGENAKVLHVLNNCFERWNLKFASRCESSLLDGGCDRTSRTHSSSSCPPAALRASHTLVSQHLRRTNHVDGSALARRDAELCGIVQHSERRERLVQVGQNLFI